VRSRSRASASQSTPSGASLEVSCLCESSFHSGLISNLANVAPQLPESSDPYGPLTGQLMSAIKDACRTVGYALTVLWVTAPH